MRVATASARSSSSRRYDGELRRLLPAGADIFDAHLHLGHDIDGMVGDYDQLEALMARYGISRAFMFCLDEPDRHPSFSAANDRTLAFAERSGRPADPVRPPRPERVADRGGDALPRRRRARDQAPSARAEVHGDRRAARAGVRARRRAARADPDPRRARPAADRRRAARARRPLPGATLIIAHAGIADLGAARRRDGRAARASSSTRRPGARSTCSTSTARCRPSRSSTRATTRTASSRRRS